MKNSEEGCRRRGFTLGAKAASWVTHNRTEQGRYIIEVSGKSGGA